MFGGAEKSKMKIETYIFYRYEGNRRILNAMKFNEHLLSNEKTSYELKKDVDINRIPKK